MIHVTKLSIATAALAPALAIGLVVTPFDANPAHAGASGLMLAQAMVPPTGMMDATKPTPMEQRYLSRYPQPVRVGDLIGLPVIDLHDSTIGYVQQIVRTQQGKIRFIVSYSRWWGWFGRTIAVPLEALGIQGRELVSLDMPPADYAKAPTWNAKDVTALSPDATIKIALARA